MPFPVSCGHCFFCKHGFFSQCDNSNPNGETGGLLGYSDAYGGYAGGQAEYLRVPYANVGPVVVPEGLTDEERLLYEEYTVSMIDERNAGMADQAVELLESGEICFYIVGAGHMVGETGLVAALERAGYTVEQR